MDGASFSSCPSSGATYTGLATGQHTFRVRAVDSDNEVEANPPAFSFAVVTPPPAGVTCRKGFRKKRVGGVVKCVKKHRRHRHHHRP
jgi:hypothetical protein